MPNTEFPPSDEPHPWLSKPAEEVVAHPEVDHVVLDRYWALQEIVLKTGRRIRRNQDKEAA
jgi:hypothetical protein